MASNRSPSPLSSRNYRNSEVSSTTRKSFSGNPFARPTALINPKNSNPCTPSNTPTATTDLMKRNSITRKSIGGGLMFQDGKENRKDAFRSPAKTASRNFMSPTISAASKFTPSPRKKILGEKNDFRASVEFLGKDSDRNSVAANFDPTIKKNDESHESKIVEQKEVLLENPSINEVNLSSTTFEDSEFVNIRPLCCSPITSPVVTDSEQDLPPYDPKKNFLSPRPQFLRYKPNPRIEFLLNKEGNDGVDDYGEDDVTRLEESFNLESEYSSETEEKEQENDKEAELGDDPVDSVDGSSGDLCETVLEEKPFDSKAEKVSKPRFFTGFLGSKTVCFVFVLFLVACVSLSFTESPPIDLPIYEDVGFSEIYHGSLRFAASAKESFDDVVANVKKWSMDLVSYISHKRFQTHKIGSIQFFNLTTSPIQEEFQLNRHIGTDYIQQIQEFEEETGRMVEEDDDEVVSEEIDDESDVVDEVVTEEPINEQIQSDVDEIQEEKLNLYDVQEEKLNLDEVQEKNLNLVEAVTEVQGKRLNLGEGFVSKTEATYEEAQSEMVEDDLEIESSSSMATICVAAFIMVAMAVSTVVYMKQKKSNALNSAVIHVNESKEIDMHEESGSSESSSVQKGYKKKSNNKRESLASSSSDFTMSESFGSFTKFERIAIKHKDEVMLTPIRRSSRLLKNQAIYS